MWRGLVFHKINYTADFGRAVRPAKTPLPYRRDFREGAILAIACGVVGMFNSARVSALNADQADPQPALTIWTGRWLYSIAQIVVAVAGCHRHPQSQPEREQRWERHGSSGGSPLSWRPMWLATAGLWSVTRPVPSSA